MSHLADDPASSPVNPDRPARTLRVGYKIARDRPLIGPISLGCATFGREIDAAASFALMDAAFARGITHFDTAAGYSKGGSEKIVGDWIASRGIDPTQILVATKVLPPYTPDALDANVAASASRLGVEMIDILYLHTWDAAALTPATLVALDRLVRSRRVRTLGASNFTAAQLAECVRLQTSLGLAPFRIIQNNHNLAVRSVDDELRALCAARDIAVITYSPLGAGFLTGKHRQGVAAGSRFEFVPGHQAIYFNPAAERRLTALEKIAASSGHAMSRLALAWALHQPYVTSVLIGGRTLAHLEQAFDALELNDPDLFDQLTHS